ncbi:MAG: hypothetical protein LBD48_07145 [Treponema sp.]|jgi:hypothetical protein|nr:hypothetical protein [Treponema sp.]
MLKKIKDNCWLLLSAAAVFVLVYLFFALAHPVVPYDNDDWNYLGLFRRALPLGTEWNPSRVFQEVITPLAGHFSAFVVYPLTHDYVASFSITTALICAAFMTALFVFLYRLFVSLCSGKIIAAFSALVVICLFFVFLKTQQDSAYMLHGYNLNTIFAYSIPNVLNSILVCFLMFCAANNINAGLNHLGIKKMSLFVIAAYCAIFSMLFSNVILAVYCFYALLFSVLKKEKLSGKIAPAVILAGVIYYCYLEFFGTRANSELGGSSTASLFSMEFVLQLRQSWWNFLGMLKQIHKPVLSASLVVIFLALILCLLNREYEKKSRFLEAMVISLCSCISIAAGLVLVCGKAGPNYSSLIQCMYGVFFFYFLLTGIALTYVVSKLRKALVVLPLLLLILVNEATNSTHWYAEQAYYDQDYFGNRIGSFQKQQLVNQWIGAIREADERGDGAVVIRVPASVNPEWPVSVERFGELFANTLYGHKIISRHITIIPEPDMDLTAWIGFGEIKHFPDTDAESETEGF